MSNPPLAVQIAEIDPANSMPEVVASFFTGGAHCCTETEVVTADHAGSGWQKVAVDEFDGAELLASDPAKTGEPYSKSPTALSSTPLRVMPPRWRRSRFLP